MLAATARQQSTHKPTHISIFVLSGPLGQHPVSRLLEKVTSFLRGIIIFTSATRNRATLLIVTRGVSICVRRSSISTSSSTSSRSLLLASLLPTLDLALPILAISLFSFRLFGCRRRRDLLAQLESTLLAGLLACKWRLGYGSTLDHIDWDIL